MDCFNCASPTPLLVAIRALPDLCLGIASGRLAAARLLNRSPLSLGTSGAFFCRCVSAGPEPGGKPCVGQLAMTRPANLRFGKSRPVVSRGGSGRLTARVELDYGHAKWAD